jgi:hypothetical protein
MTTLIGTVLGFAIVLGVWYTLQEIIRRWRYTDDDALASICKSCAGCQRSGSCHTSTPVRDEEHHHESA